MEKGARGSASLDLFSEESHRLEQTSDEEDGLSTPSNYSSCGSELDRYCSANSVLGTVSSVCSSVGNHNELLDNLRSLGLGEEVDFYGGRVKVRRRGRFARTRKLVDLGRSDWLSDGTAESPRENGSLESPVLGGSHRFRMVFDRVIGNSGDNVGEEIDVEVEGRENVMMLSERNDAGDDARSSGALISVCEDRVDCDRNSGACHRASASDCWDKKPVVLDDDVLAISGYSDGEDSVLDSGTDDEERVREIQKVALEKFKDSKINIDTNPLLISADVAFGDNDWDEFMQEDGGVGLASSHLFGLETSKQAEQHLSLDGVCRDIYVQEGQCTALTQENGHVDNVENMPMSRTSHPHVYGKSEATLPPDEDTQKGFLQKTAISTHIVGDLNAANNYHNLRDDIDDKEAQLANERIVDFRGHNNQDAMFDGESHLPLPEVNEMEIENKRTGKATASLTLDYSCDPDISGKDTASEKANGQDSKELFEEMVLDMEEILLDSGESRQGRYAQAMYMSQHFLHGDGISTASTSDTNGSHALYQHPFRIEGVEVVGARQKKGNVSFGERLVGVKEYTVYRLRVWSGKDQWEVERRYREFFSLYRQLKTLFKEHGLVLPSPWHKVESESRNFFGNISLNVVNERSSLIQDCLLSILNAKTPFGTPSSLILFLSPSKYDDSSSSSRLLPQSPQSLAEDSKSFSSRSKDNYLEEVTTLGKKISLEVELKVHKAVRQSLEEQRYMCAGCHRHLDSGKNLMTEFVKVMGWGKPRLCEYTGQLFCSSCHGSDTAVLPARVLHNWDFSLYPVSQLAKAYLDSIYDKPMLCVSAVNPFLFSKVPALHNIMGLRRKIGAIVPYIRCPFQRSIQRGLGSRRYLLESNDFFALRDLVDLSKGPFAALPAIMEAASTKILEHITQQCLVCYDIGCPCAAKEACRDPASAILPFQESESVRCSLCSAIFHEPCIRYLGGCPCSRPAKISVDKMLVPPKPLTNEEPMELITLQRRDSGASPATGFLYDLLAKATPEKLWKRKDSSPVILMSSLASTSS